MVWVLLVVLTASVCGILAVKMFPTVYRLEDDNITVTLDSHDQTDLSLANIVCLLLSKPLKVLYQMIDGAELPESQHQQFAGRVLCDGDALRRGRVRLHVSRVTAEDSGDYRCDLAADYNGKEDRWRLKTTEMFVLNVSHRGANSDVSLNTPKLPEGKPGGSKTELIGYLMAVCAVVLVAVFVGHKVYLRRCSTQASRAQDQDAQSLSGPLK
uniref:uncharacterized protein LOC124054753 n=1 Tax=Scatophagus argus TaxID=75038 RepID=UPI001ED7CE18|nr:uncharacterized protein LOC124054753 [Scatophagus argus]